MLHNQIRSSQEKLSEYRERQKQEKDLLTKLIKIGLQKEIVIAS